MPAADARALNGATPRLPRLWRGRRRALLMWLTLCGVAQAGISAGTAVFTPDLIAAPASPRSWWIAGVLVVLAVALGGLRTGEWILGEALGQDYVHDVRVHLMRSAVAGRGPSVGVTVARATNDLASVRNWMVQGIVPLLVGIPMIVGSVVVLTVLAWPLGVAVTVPLVILGLVLALSAKPLQTRARELRRQRGKVSGRIADTVQASKTVVSAGGLEREVKRLSKDSREMGRRAVARAVISGAMRGSAASVATLIMVLVGAVGAIAGVPTAAITTAFLIVGMMASPITDLGRVGEYRQSFLVAERILAPQVEISRSYRREARAVEQRFRALPAQRRGSGLHVADLKLGGVDVPELVARPGEVIVPVSDVPAQLRELVSVLARPLAQPRAWLQVDGLQLTQLPDSQRRELVSVASLGQPIERGTLARAVRYRVPESENPSSWCSPKSG